MKKYILILLAITSLLLISCNPDGIGIFYKISVEPALSTSALSEKSVYKIVDLSGVKYVLAGGTVYRQSGSDWAPLPTPSGEIQAVSLLSDGTTIFSIYADNQNSSMYEFNGSTWIVATNTASLNNSNDLTLVEGDGSYFFICEETSGYDFNIYSYTTATNALTDITPSNIPATLVDGAFDGTNYYLISSNYSAGNGNSEIYTTNGTSDISAISGTTSGFDYTKAIGGIIADGTDLYISTKSGILYKSVDGTTWIAVNTTALANKKLGSMAIVTGINYLLIGSNGGFYEMNLSGGTPVTPTAVTIGSTVYESVNLYTEIVQSILSVNANEFYIGSSNGLWYSNTNELILK